MLLLYGGKVKCGNKNLEDQNNSNEIILTGFFLKVKEDFPFLNIQKGDRSHLTTPFFAMPLKTQRV